MSIEELYGQARQGDLDAEKRLFDELAVRLRLVAFRYTRNEDDAKDAVQEAMVRIIGDFREKHLKDSLSAWSYTVLKYEILNRARTSRRRRELRARYSEETDLQTFRPDPDLEMNLARCLRRLIQSYPRYARVLNLKYQGYPTEQICEKLRITRDNLYVLHSRARAELKGCLAKGGPDK